MTAKHARLPASAAHRWTACPASAYMDSSGDDRGSKYAAEGTAAHALAERCLLEEQSPRELMSSQIAVAPKGTTSWPPDGAIIPSDCWIFEVDPEMVDAIELFLQATQDALIIVPPGGVQYIEERVSPGHPSLGGTLDWAYVSDRHAAIADLKYGRGVVVEVQDNPQQMIYALGLLARHPKIEVIYSYIVQPRARHADGPIRWAAYTAEELKEFYDWLLERIAAADTPGAPRNAGSHCRFCPDLGNCAAVFAAAQEEAAMDFTNGEDGDRLPAALTFAPIAEAWVKAVRKEALSRLMDEREIVGWKLVHGRGSRAWTVEEKDVLRFARQAGILKAGCFTAPKLLSPHGLEKAAAKGGMTSKGASAHFADLWESILGGPAIAPEDDPRKPYVHSPEDDFDAQ